jgi:hypothetical protein
VDSKISPGEGFVSPGESQLKIREYKYKLRTEFVRCSPATRR